jgi:hypothetical protein
MGCLVQLCPGSSPRILEERAGGRSSREEDHLPRDPYPRQGDAVLDSRPRTRQGARDVQGYSTGAVGLSSASPCSS